MKKNEIRIDRLEIRLKGADVDGARDLGAAIGEQVLQEIAAAANAARRRSIRIAQIDAGTLHLEPGTRSRQSGAAIASRIAAGVKSRMSRESNKH